MIIRVSFMVVASVTALKISQIKRNNTIKSPANKESDDSHLEHEFEEREKSIANADHGIQNEEEKQTKIEMPQNLSGEKMDYFTEKELLQNLIQNYRQREIKIERKLVKLNSLKEEKLAMAQMQRELEKKEAKLDSLKTTIASLQSESKIIQEKIREDVLSKRQLEIVNKIIYEMQRKRDINESPVKDQILMLQQQVTELRKFNGSGRNAVKNKKLREAQEIELEVLELKRRNKELELEKREMGVKMSTVQARIRTEEETLSHIQEEITGLKHVQEELSEQVERLERNRFDMVEELVYQRWLYTCLRFEAHNHQNQIRKASIQDCIKISGKELYDQKTDALTPDSELDSISSNATLNESDEIETTTLESSSSSQSSRNSKNSSLFNKMKRWKKTKDNNMKVSPKGRNSPSRNGLIRRFSMSMVESDLSKPRNSGGEGDSPVMNIEKVPMTRLKRVSFSDSVKPSYYHQNITEEVEDVIDENKETNSGQILELFSAITSSDEHKEEEQSAELCKSNEYAVGNTLNIDYPAENEGTKNQIGHSDEVYSKNELVGGKHDRIKKQVVQLLVFFFFLLILLAYLRIK